MMGFFDKLHLPPKGKALGPYFIFPTYTRYEYK